MCLFMLFGWQSMDFEAQRSKLRLNVGISDLGFDPIQSPHS